MGFFNVPNLPVDADDESGLITSDSDFDKVLMEAGINDTTPGPQDRPRRKPANQKKDVSKTFKKMLSMTHKINPGVTKDNNDSMKMFSNAAGDNDSTKYGGSIKQGEQFLDNQT